MAAEFADVAFGATVGALDDGLAQAEGGIVKTALEGGEGLFGSVRFQREALQAVARRGFGGSPQDPPGVVAGLLFG